MSALITAIITILTPIIGLIVKKITQSIDKSEVINSSNADKRAIYKEFCDICLKAVTRVDVEFVSKIKESGFSETHQQEAKEKAAIIIKDSYGYDGLTKLAIFFDTDALGLEKIIGLHIEAAIMDLKNIDPKSVG